MSELTDLYQEILLDHYRRPRNFGPLPDADHEVDGHNPLCGDRVKVRVKLDHDRLAEIRFEGSGCAISTASASMMTEAVRGRSLAEVESIAERFRALLTAERSGAPSPEDEAALGDLAALGGVREFPMRVKCATLAWHALRSAIAAGGAPVSTE